MKNYIFLSYSRTDIEMMQRIKKSLVLAGFQVWTDEGIKPGTPSWTNSITTAIKLSACIVCLVSPDSAQSSWVDREITYAEMLEKPIFPVLIRGTRKDAVIFRLVNIQDVDISKDYSKIDQLIERLNEIIDVDAMSERGVNLPPPVPDVLPQPFDWCEIPTGEARLASGGYVPDEGLTIFVDRFYMAKYPVNAEHLNLKQTTSVTQFPDGASPYRVMDMIGNTWEWSASAWQDGRTEQDGDAFRVLRGGSFADYMLSSYSVSRFNHEPPNCRYNDFGFRVCVR